MIEAWLYLNEDSSYTVFYIESAIPKSLLSETFKAEIPESGEGILRMADDGMFYYEPFPEDLEVNPQPTPIEPQPTVEEMQAQILLNTEYLVSRIELGLGGK